MFAKGCFFYLTQGAFEGSGTARDREQDVTSTFCAFTLLASFLAGQDLPRELGDEREVRAEDAGGIDELEFADSAVRLPLVLGDPQVPRAAARGFFGRVEGNAFLGVAIPGSNFEAGATWTAGVLGRLPAPGLPTGRFGIFGQGLISYLDRDLPSFYSDLSGSFYTFTVGLDFKLFQDETWWLLAQAGGVYAYFGGIAGLENGFGGELGLQAGIHFIRRNTQTSITLNPQFIYDGKDWILFANVGLHLQF